MNLIKSYNDKTGLYFVSTMVRSPSGLRYLGKPDVCGKNQLDSVAISSKLSERGNEQGSAR